MVKKFFTIVAIFFLLLSGVYAQSYKLFTSDNELPSSMISYIYQDRFGFIWIATENGLVKYDGARFVTYTHSPSDPNSLAHDFVTALAEDKLGNLYVSTYAGVQVYSYATDHFSENVTWEDGSDFGENSNHVYCTSSGDVYSAGYSICRLVYSDGRLTAHKLACSISYKNYTKVQEDSNQVLWVSANGQNSLLRIVGEDIVQTYVFPESSTTLTDFIVTQDGTVYAAVFGQGIVEYNRYRDAFELIIPEFAGTHVNNIYNVGERLFFSAEQNPIYLYERRKHTLSELNLDFGNFHLDECNVQRHIIDNEGNVWIGISQKGVVMVPSDNSPFRYLGSRTVLADFVGQSPISAIYQDSYGSTWIGTSGEGVYCLKGSDMTNAIHFDRPANVTHFLENADGTLWITGSNSGVSSYNYKTGKVQHSAISTDNGPIPTAHDLNFDNQGRLWIASMGNGLYCSDPKRGRTFNVNQINPMIHSWIACLHVSDEGSLWLGTYDGLEKVNINSDNYENQRFLKRTIVYDIKQDRQQSLWLATSAGLFNMSIAGDTIRVFTNEDGLPSQSLASLQIDSDGLIWVSSNLGLSKVDPSSGTIINFYSGDGLQGNEFCKNASYRDNQDRLWFGGISGVTYFSPNDVKADSNPWHVRIVALSIAGREVTTETLSGGKRAIDAPIFEASSVSLAHGDNAFSIYFATEELNCPDKFQFEYNLNGQSWQRLPVGVHSVSFSNLATGTYQFAVRAVNNQRGSTVRTLRIVIRPVWYESWWANLLFLAVVLSFLVLIFLTIRSHYREKNERTLAEKQLAMHDAQTRFFIDITHEIRTPLQLIIGPVKKLLATDADSSRQVSYSTIQRNADRILRLMDQMIDIRKIDKGVLTMHFVEKNIVEMLNGIFADFVEQARIKNIAFSIDHDSIDSLPVWVDANYFDKIFINLISNALKYTPKGGKVRVELRRVGDERVKVSVIDNGPGIPLSERNRIFDRFYRGRNAEGTKIQGSGIGLSLTRSLVEMHHGTIELYTSTEAPTGSTFTVTIPLGRAHLVESEIGEVQTEQVELDVHSAMVEESVEQKVYSKTKYRILVVDDEDEILQYLVKELSTDFHAVGCSNGKDAIAMLQHDKFDLVISDVMMPVMDGEELCRKIRQNINLNHLPVIFLTANTEENAVISGLDTGADDYLVKPVSLNLLRSRIYNLLHSRERLFNNYSGKQIDDDKLDELHVKTPDEQLMERVMRVINSNLSNQEFTVEMLADKVGMSRVHLNRKLKELTNQTARDYIRNVRLKQAATLLSQGDHPINQIAELVGFSNASNFTTAFRNLYGVSPKDYK